MLWTREGPQDYVINDPETLTEIKNRARLHDSLTGFIDAIVNVFENAWFRRAWSFQEDYLCP